MNRNNIIQSLPVVLLMVLTLASAAAGAQALRESLFAEADAAYSEARDAEAALLAPRNFERGEKAYKSAEEALDRGRNVEVVRSRLADATARFREAAETAGLTRLSLSGVIKTRIDARKADAPTLSQPIWADAEDKFADAIRVLERGDLKSGQRYGIEAESLYRDAELGAIKTRYLSETRRLLADAERARVGRYAPVTLQKSKDLLARAEKELNENRYDTDLPRSLAQQANYEARHAIYLAEVVRRVRDKDLSTENLVLSWEAPLAEVANAADIVPDLANGGETLAEQLAAYIVELREANQALTQEVQDNEVRVTELSEEIRLLDEKLGGATAERAALMQRLQRQARVREQFDTVEKMFARDEALVFREGNKVTLRLVGLSFASGQAAISPELYPLLEKVEKAINVFPRSTIAIEGHTDSYGGDQTNQDLSQSRADAVEQYMLNAMRIPSNRLSAIGYGETRPIANNETSQGRARNRRIDIVLEPRLD
ncbi:MAG: OmpA family protein [Pseudomonadota bacterium]